MSNLEKIDRNFAVETSLKIEGIRFYDVKQAPFTTYGLIYEDGQYQRMPAAVAETVSDRVYAIHYHTSGGRVKFVTNSSYIAIKAEMPSITRMSHFALAGSAGFDLYVGKREQYFSTFMPPCNMQSGYENVIHFPDRKKREITINFPLYSPVSALYIGLEDTATVTKTAGYAQDKPLVFYGSSITQGGCASRPGNAYSARVARALQMDYINLGFSGNAKGEQEMADYIAGLNMAAFIYDYDYNAPDVAHLEQTHQRMFQTVRRANPTLPILILSRPKYYPTEEEKQRLAIIRKTYTDAIAGGDQNVYFIDGKTLMKYAKNDGTVDGVHPTDLGFDSMAKVLTQKLKTIL